MKDRLFRCGGGAILAAGLLAGAFASPVEAAGFRWFFKNVRPTGQCGAAREVAVSYYMRGRRTANGERFNPNGLTAAHRSLPFGSRIHLTNPRNGRSVAVRINDRGPYGPAHRLGVKFDLARGAARALGLLQTDWVCVHSSAAVRTAAPRHQRRHTRRHQHAQTEPHLAW